MATSINHAIRALDDPTRRRILVALLEQSPLSDTALNPVEQPVAEGETERRGLALYHNHLPMLEDAGLIGWDRDRREIVKGANFDEIRPILTLLRDDPDVIAEPA